MPGGRPRRPLRSHGAITVTQLPDGRWRARCQVRDPDGHTRRPEKHGPSRAKAKRALEEHLAVRWDTDHTAPTATMREFSRRWLDERAAEAAGGRLASGTLDLDRMAVDTHLTPMLGELAPREVTVRVLNSFFATVADTAGVGAARTCRRVVSILMKRAVAEELIGANPLLNANPIRSKKQRRPEGLDQAGREALLEKLRNDERAVESGDLERVRFLLGTGARISELCGLVWPRVDLAGAVLELGATPSSETGKAKASIRELPVPGFVTGLLAARWEWSVEPFGPVWPSRRDPARFASPATEDGRLNTLFDRVGMPEVTCHTLRRTFAWVLRDAGFTTRQIADMLGHSNVATTEVSYLGRGRMPLGAPDALQVMFGGL